MSVNTISKWSLSVLRLSVSAGLILAAWLLATCGAPSGSSSKAAIGEGVLVDFRRTGGIAGFDDHLIIRAGGDVTLERKGGVRHVFTVDKTVVLRLQQAIEEAGFFELASQAHPAEIIPDALIYRITCQTDGRRHTVETSDGAIPQQLMPLIDELNQITAQAQ